MSDAPDPLFVNLTAQLGMPPEALLIHLRTAWDEAGLTRRYPRRKDWYDHLVMHCLEEYYKPVVE